MPENTAPPSLDRLHHVAISVENIAESVAWYTSRLNCRVSYQDDTWAMLDFDNVHLALLSTDRHPPHIGLMRPDAEQFGPLKPHRDGTRSVYVEDPSGNSVEILKQE